jgi:hypothetical protein
MAIGFFPDYSGKAELSAAGTLDGRGTAAAKRPEILKWADGRAGFQVVPELIRIKWGIGIVIG